jgi:rubrerythrin
MANLKGSKTEQNLLKAFAGESQARNRYDYFASVAKKEGYEQISAYFAETALNEKEHAKRFFKFLEGGMTEITATYPAGKIGTTADNLKASAAGEHEEWAELYPEFARVAEEEGFLDVADTFKFIAKAEVGHETRYLKLLENIEKNEVFKRGAERLWKCRNCGYLHDGEGAPDKCPACQHEKAYFELYCENY